MAGWRPRAGTVHRHVTSILRKLQLPTRAAAATAAARHGLVKPGLAIDPASSAGQVGRSAARAATPSVHSCGHQGTVQT
jgi:hypothetical protein